MNPVEHSNSEDIITGSATTQFIARTRAWQRVLDGAFPFCGYVILGTYVAISALAHYAERLSVQSPYLPYVRWVTASVAATWLCAFVVHELIGFSGLRLLRIARRTGQTDRVIWSGEKLGSEDSLEVMRGMPFGMLVSEFPLWTRMPAWFILMLELAIVVVAILAGYLLLIDIELCILGAIAVAIGLLILDPYAFPNRIRFGPGRLQTIRASRISNQVVIEEDISLKTAAVTLITTAPTLILLEWTQSDGDHQLRIHNMPPEFCFYVWLAAVSHHNCTEFPAPRVGEVLVGIDPAAGAEKIPREE